MNCHHSRWSLHWNLLPAATVDGRMVTVLFGSSQLALKIMSIANPSCQTGFDLQTECIENMWKLLTFSYSPGLSPPISTHSNSKSIHPRSPQLGVVLALRCGPLLRRRWNGRASHRKGCETDGPLSGTRGKSSNAAICQQKSKFTWIHFKIHYGMAGSVPSTTREPSEEGRVLWNRAKMQAGQVAEMANWNSTSETSK